MKLLLVRHGHVVDVAGRCVGSTDVALSEEGKRAMRETAAYLRDECANERTRIVSSDLPRAVQSAEIVAAALRVPIERDARLREMSFGAWDGRLWSEIERSDRDRYEQWMGDWVRARPPGGETVDDLYARVDGWLSGMESAHASGSIVVVAHAGWIRAALTRVLARSPSEMFDLRVDYASVSILDIAGAPGSGTANSFRTWP